MIQTIICQSCGTTIIEGHGCGSFRYETCLECKRERALSESLSCNPIILDEITESTLSRENARELASLAGKLGQAHEEY